MITVNFRVTGLFLGKNNSTAKCKNPIVMVEVQDNPTVFDIMKAVSEKVKNGGIPSVTSFVFTPSQPLHNEDISAIFVTYASREDGKPDGTYMLRDEYNSNSTNTFQYYIFNQDFKQLNVDNVFISFAQTPTETIKNGYTVIIRQVSIANQPIKSNFIQKKVEKLS
jgi:hypothetical protein